MALDKTPGHKQKPKKTSSRRGRDVGLGLRDERGRPIPAAGGASINTGTGRITGTGKAERAAEAAANPVSHQSSEALRRQRLLRAAGFKVVADGVWGPRSQAAWNMYLQKRSANPSAFGPLKPEKGGKLSVANVTQSTTGLNAAMIARERKLAAEAARKAFALQVIKEREETLTRANLLRKDPRKAREMTLRQIASVVLDDEVGFGVRSDAGARAFQEWGNAHGYRMPISGKYDTQTHDVLKRAWRDSERASLKKHVYIVNRDLYGPLGIHAGDKPSWWPADKPVPTAQEFAGIVHGYRDKDGKWIPPSFEGHVLLNAMLHQAVTGARAFDAIRRRELIKTAVKLQPFDFTDYAKMLRLGQAPGLGGLLSDIYGIKDLSPRFDTPEGMAPDVAARIEQAYVETKQTRLANSRALISLHAEVSAMATAVDGDDFKARLGGYMKHAEDQFVAAQIQIASQSLPWWGRAVDEVMSYGKFLRTALTYDAMRGAQLLAGAGENERAIQWEDALVVNNYADADDLPEYDKLMDGPANVGLRLAFELTADPLNVAHPIRAASTMLRVGSKGTQLGTYGLHSVEMGFLDQAGSYLTRGKIDKLWGRSLVYHKGSMAAWSELAWDVTEIGAGAFGSTISRDMFRASRANAAMVQQTALRDEALAMARESATLQARHGFQKRNPFVTMPFRGVKSGKTVRLTEEAKIAGKSWIHSSPELRPIIDALKEDYASLYVDVNQVEMSNVGASLRSSYAERARVQTIHGVATERSQEVYDATLEVLGETDDAVAEASRVAFEEYKRVVDSEAGSYLKGGSVSKELKQLIDRRVRQQLDLWDWTYAPVIQEMLQENADMILARDQVAAQAMEGAEAISHKLWGEDGLWVGRHGESARTLRALGRESFEQDKMISAYNPQSAYGHEAADFSELLEYEIRSSVGRYQGNVARRRAAGEMIEDSVFHEQVAKIRKEIVGAWRQDKSTGLWWDTRETVEISDLYARHLAVAGYTDGAIDGVPTFRGRVEALAKDDPIRALSMLAETPKFADASDVGRGLWDFAWMTGVKFRSRLPGETLTHATRPSGPALPDTARDLHAARTEALHDWTTKHQFAMSRGFDEVLAKEIAARGALWLSLQHGQSLPAKLAYNTLSGILNTWIFATLPLRPGWTVRNVIDNTAKIILAGVHDPRVLFFGGANPGAGIRSVFDLGLRDLRTVIGFLDQLFGNNGEMLAAWMRVEDMIWEMGADVMRSIFNAHGMEDVPYSVLSDTVSLTGLLNKRGGSRGGPLVNTDRARQLGLDVADPTFAQRDAAYKNAVAAWEEGGRVGKKPKRGAPAEDAPEGKLTDSARARAEAWKDLAWEFLANKPESWARRVLYRDTFRKELAKLDNLPEVEARLRAHDVAVAKVNETLFDYSEVTVIEDNLRVFVPFIQFWRKNSTLWMQHGVNKPWLVNALIQVDEWREEIHADLPAWMRRYFHSEEITDAAAVVPGLDVVVDALIPDGTQYDPLNLMSFAPFFRAFKSQNPNLPPEEQGAPIFGPMIDAMSDFGMGLNPFFRKPLESAGIASERNWQFMFPQTSLAVAISRKWFGENMALTVSQWESLWGLLPLGVPSDEVAEQFEYYVQQEIAGQVARGNTPNEAEARKTITAWFYLQNVYGYFTGTYLRRATPEDIYLSKLNETGTKYQDMSGQDADALKLWRMRGADRLSFERYLDIMPFIKAYYASDGWEEKQRLKREHPELMRFVDATFRGTPYSGKWVKYAQRYTDTERFMLALRITEGLDASYDTQQAALAMFKDNDLEAYWARNDTPAQVKASMIRSVGFEYYRDLNSAYHEIPADDFDAKDGFLDEHPELVRHWNRNNDPENDYEAIIRGANATLREEYFAIKDAKGWDAAAPFLKAHPFIFEDTRSAAKVKDGEWVHTGGGGNWSSEHAEDFRRAKPHLRWFFDTYLPSVGKQAAWGWLSTSDSDVARILKEYFRKWSKGGGRHHGRSQKAIDYLRAQSWLKHYFNMPVSVRGDWLNGDSEGAGIVRDYFAKYSHGHGQTQHGKDYLAVKSILKAYFAMSKKERGAWLNGDSADAKALLAYFKKYGKTHQMGRKFEQLGLSTLGTPEQRRRVIFWQKFFALDPDQRPAFIASEAEKYGVFVWGEFGEQERYDREQEYLRRAVGLGATDRQAAFLYAKPLLDFYYKLPKEDRALFARANPEILAYLEKYSDGKVTGDKKLDAAIEAYFKLAPDSFARSEFLRKNPLVQDYFDSRATPAEAAMRNLLEQYFDTDDRREFLERHPEVAAYFEARRLEKSAEGNVYDAFDQADPRMRPFYKDTEELIQAAATMRDRLRNASLDTFAVEGRRTRRPVR